MRSAFDDDMDFDTRTPGLRARFAVSPMPDTRLILLLGVMLSSGCTTLADTTYEKGIHAPLPATSALSASKRSRATHYNDIVATDFSRAIEQTLPAHRTTIQISPAGRSALLDALSDRLADAGFGIQRVATTGGEHLLGHTSRSEPVSGDIQRSLERITVGSISVERAFDVHRDGTVATAGPLHLSGTNAAIGYRTLEQAGLHVSDRAHRIVRYTRDPETSVSSPIDRLVTRDVIDRVAFGPGKQLGWQSLGARTRSAAGDSDMIPVTAGRTALSTGRESSPSSSTSARSQSYNLFYGTGAFESAFSGMNKIDRQVIVFPNDSIRLGPDNKRVIASFVNQTIGKRDHIALVGCSNGTTRSPLGNEGLALGRARRVIDELIAHGVDRERIHDEGCWAPVSAGDEFPKRGVLLSVWRSAA